MRNPFRDGAPRWAWMVALSGWLAASGCLCYGGGEPPPEDDDSSDDDATDNTEYPDYDVTGFYLDIGRDTGGGQYEGIVILESGSLSMWTGMDGAHQDEVWVATLTEGQLDQLIIALDPTAFFASSIDDGGDCEMQFRLDTQSNTAIHPAGSVPDSLDRFYDELDDMLAIFDVDNGCS
jgi:hypothetical protein